MEGIMAHNIDSMAYYGEVPWHGLGVEVPSDANAVTMIKAARLDWEVEMRPAPGACIDKKGKANRYVLVRRPRENTEEQEILLGVVTNRYRPLQNVDAFSFFDPIIGEGKSSFETAGSLGQGERVWVMARPNAMQIVRGDDCCNYLLLSNTHTGEGSVSIKFTSVRVVCQNTLMLAMDDGQKAYFVRHSKNMLLRLDELAEFISIMQKVFLKAEQEFKRLAQVEMIKGRMNKYLETLFPLTEAQKKKGETPPKWQYIKEVFESRPDLQLGGVRGTLWGAYNAVAAFEDYRQPKQEEPGDQRLERTWFGSGAELKQRALEKANEFANDWLKAG
jgi:phage/plasmid-like protein (TIGR03299 family)